MEKEDVKLKLEDVISRIQNFLEAEDVSFKSSVLKKTKKKITYAFEPTTECLVASALMPSLKDRIMAKFSYEETQLLKKLKVETELVSNKDGLFCRIKKIGFVLYFTRPKDAIDIVIDGLDVFCKISLFLVTPFLAVLFTHEASIQTEVVSTTIYSTLGSLNWIVFGMGLIGIRLDSEKDSNEKEFKELKKENKILTDKLESIMRIQEHQKNINESVLSALEKMNTWS